MLVDTANPRDNYSTFTLLFQDQHGGLELKDAKTKEYLHAEPEEGAFVLNAGDMLQRFTNGAHLLRSHEYFTHV